MTLVSPGFGPARPGQDPFDPFVDYVTARLTEDPHLWVRTLYDELEELGFDREPIRDHYAHVKFIGSGYRA